MPFYRGNTKGPGTRGDSVGRRTVPSQEWARTSCPILDKLSKITLKPSNKIQTSRSGALFPSKYWFHSYTRLWMKTSFIRFNKNSDRTERHRSVTGPWIYFRGLWISKSKNQSVPWPFHMIARCESQILQGLLSWHGPWTTKSSTDNFHFQKLISLFRSPMYGNTFVIIPK